MVTGQEWSKVNAKQRAFIKGGKYTMSCGQIDEGVRRDCKGRKLNKQEVIKHFLGVIIRVMKIVRTVQITR